MLLSEGVERVVGLEISFFSGSIGLFIFLLLIFFNFIGALLYYSLDAESHVFEKHFIELGHSLYFYESTFIYVEVIP